MSIILGKLEEGVQKILIARGVPRADFIHSRRDRFDVSAMLSRYESELPGLPAKVVASGKQLRNLEKVIEHPIRSSYTLAICGYPSDQIAKYLAIQIAAEAVKAWNKHHKPGQTLPYWHRVYGGLNDALRDRVEQEENPAMLIMSNINESSSNYKLEKVRDLLEKYSHIPRILVIGSNDPIKFFATKLYAPLNVGLCIMPINRIKEDL